MVPAQIKTCVFYLKAKVPVPYEWGKSEEQAAWLLRRDVQTALRDRGLPDPFDNPEEAATLDVKAGWLRYAAEVLVTADWTELAGHIRLNLGSEAVGWIRETELDTDLFDQIKVEPVTGIPSAGRLVDDLRHELRTQRDSLRQIARDTTDEMARSRLMYHITHLEEVLQRQ